MKLKAVKREQEHLDQAMKVYLEHSKDVPNEGDLKGYEPFATEYAEWVAMKEKNSKKIAKLEAMRDKVSPACPPSLDPELHSEAFRRCATSDVYYAPPVAQFLWKLLVRSVPGKQSCHVSSV